MRIFCNDAPVIAVWAAKPPNSAVLNLSHGFLALRTDVGWKVDTTMSIHSVLV